MPFKCIQEIIPLIQIIKSESSKGKEFTLQSSSLQYITLHSDIKNYTTAQAKIQCTCTTSCITLKQTNRDPQNKPEVTHREHKL